jgi:hypothetical protein
MAELQGRGIDDAAAMPVAKLVPKMVPIVPEPPSVGWKLAELTRLETTGVWHQAATDVYSRTTSPRVTPLLFIESILTLK